MYAIISALTIAFVFPLKGLISDYKVIVWGGFLSGGSLVILTFPKVNFIRIAITVILFGLGNTYVSKIYDYIMAVSPKGEEGVYMSMGNLPLKA